MSFAPIEDLVSAIGRGEMVIVVDDADRENEGDLIIAAETRHPGADRIHDPPLERHHLPAR